LIGLAREANNHTQTMAAAAVGVSQTTWNHWEKHLRLPTVYESAKIVQFYFKGREEEMAGIYIKATDDWDRMGPPVPTRSYDTPNGKSGEPHRRRR
jgi:DNA-binding XRE family transcriptional regulator